MNDAYKLPEGPVAIQFSGGRTSGYMLWHILDHYDGQLPQDCHVLFQNTGREMPETLDFVHECQTRWNVPIVWLEYDPEEKYRVVSHNSAARNGEPFEAIVKKRKYPPNRVAKFCTSELKVRPSIKYMHEGLGFERWQAAIGIRADEARRLNGNSREARHTCFYPLNDACVTKRHVADFWEAEPFDLRLPNVNGKTPLGNCDGCFLKSEAILAALCREYPDRAAWWAGIEKEMGSHFRPPGEKATWEELMGYVEKQGDWIFDEQNEALCTQGFGGCHD